MGAIVDAEDRGLLIAFVLVSLLVLYAAAVVGVAVGLGVTVFRWVS